MSTASRGREAPEQGGAQWSGAFGRRNVPGRFEAQLHWATELLSMAVSAASLAPRSFPELALSGRDGLQARLASILGPRRAPSTGRRWLGLGLAASMLTLAGTASVSSFWLEDGRTTLDRLPDWKRTEMQNTALLSYSIEEAQARGGWTAVYARVLESTSRGGVIVSGDGLASLGARFWIDGKQEEARAVLRLAVRVEPDSARWFSLVAEQLRASGRADLAAQYFDMAKFLYPETGEDIENTLTKNRRR